MSTELTNPQRCVLLKNGIQLWLDEGDAKRFISDWQSKRESVVMVVNGQAFASTEVAGVYTADKMDEYTRRKNNQWKCKLSAWHDRGEKCECKDPQVEQDWQTYRDSFYKEHGYYPLKN